MQAFDDRETGIATFLFGRPAVRGDEECSVRTVIADMSCGVLAELEEREFESYSASLMCMGIVALLVGLPLFYAWLP